jgi:3-hydroxyisobutyrate dehydrogenase-like beta-hydroxyacid dehydrogenase
MSEVGMRQVVGLCGLGNMGAAIALQLSRSTSVLAYDPDPERARLAATITGVEVAADLAAFAEADRVVLSLPAPAISVQVCTSLGGILAPGSVVIETSTVTPRTVRECEAILRATGVRLVDAAILSGVAQMADGQATLLTGGDDDVLAEVDALLEALGRRRWHFGKTGLGMAAKIINNAVAHATMVLLVEAATMARAAEIPPHRIAELLADPEAGLNRPLTYRLMERVFGGEYEGGMPTQAARKDSLLALEDAHDGGVPLFVINSAHTVYDLAIADGLGREDYSAIAKLWQRWTGLSLTEAVDGLR